MEDNKEIIIEHVFDAPKELVWRAWTEPEMVKKWWGPAGFSAPSIKIDFRITGKYIFAMHGPKGSDWDKDMYTAGVYEEIVPNEKIVLTQYLSDENGEMQEPVGFGQDPNFPKETTVTVLLEEIEKGKTKLSIIYPKPKTKEQMDAILKSGMKEGWSSSLDKLAESLK